jgi:hypothetical protein
MKTDHLKIVIEEKLDVIREQFEIIKTYTGKIPSIELDLIMANIRDLYELFLELDKENQPQTPVPYKADTEKSNVPDPGIISFEPLRQEETLAGNDNLEEPNNLVHHETAPDVSASKVVEPFNRSTPPELKSKLFSRPREPVSPPEKSDRITFDLFSEGGSPLADKLKDQNELKRADKIDPRQNIRDLKSAIGINEKFLFINELFEGSLNEYENALGRLNACKEFSEASSIINLLQEKYNWEPLSESVQSFTALVRRKF